VKEDKEIDSHIRHLNCTHRKALEECMDEILKELQYFVEKAKSLGCKVQETLETNDVNTSIPELTNTSDLCMSTLTNIQSIIMRYLSRERSG
jgi:glutamate racemase